MNYRQMLIEYETCKCKVCKRHWGELLAEHNPFLFGGAL